jgi:hypothetical protein
MLVERSKLCTDRNFVYGLMSARSFRCIGSLSLLRRILLLSCLPPTAQVKVVLRVPEIDSSSFKRLYAYKAYITWSDDTSLLFNFYHLEFQLADYFQKQQQQQQSHSHIRTGNN